MYLLALSFCLKKILRTDPELSGCTIFGPKMAHLSWTKSFWYKPLLLLSSTYWVFSLYKTLKKFLQQIQSYEDAPFLGPEWPICPEQIFLWKIINIIFIYLLAPFIVQNFKKIFPQIQSYEDAQFLGPKWTISQNENFFSENLFMSFVTFIHAYLQAKSQSQILIY